MLSGASEGRTESARPRSFGGEGGSKSCAGAAARPASRLGRRRLWILRIALLVTGPAVFLALLEAGLRLAGYGYPADFLVTSDGGRTWSPNLRFGCRFAPRAAATAPDLFSIAGEKPSGTVRIFVLGESAAMGTPDPAYSFGRVLEVMLRERHPGVRFEVLNAAMMGMSSHVMLPVARDCARHNPDIFIIYAGNNEVIGFWSPCTAPAWAASCRPIVRAAVWARGMRVGQWAAAACERLGGPAGPEPQTLETFLAGAVSPDDPRLQTVCRHFRDNLADLCRTVRGAGARAVLATVATNLKDCAPLASLHRAGLTEAERAEWDALVRAGDDEERAGRPDAAARRYAQALRIDDRFADLHFRLGRCLAALGRWDEARPHYVRARDLDALPFRATGALNQAVREAAREFAADGVALVDAEEALARCEESPHGIPGEELFYEHAHMMFEGNYRLAAALLPAVEAALPPGRAAPAPVPSAQRCADALVLTARDRFRMAAAMVALTEKPPFVNQSDHAWRQERARQALARFGQTLTPETGDQEYRVYRAALALAPADCHLHRHCAMLRFELGDFASAAWHWRAVVAMFPDCADARVRLGEALARGRRLDEAAREYAEAIRCRPEGLEAYQWLTAVLQAQGRVEEAADCVSRALRVWPHPAGYRTLGDLLVKQGRLAEAVAPYRRGLELAPQDPGLHESLAAALAAQEELDEAAAHLQAVLQADPEHVVARCALARVLARQGKAEEAAQEYRQVLLLNPGYPEALSAVGGTVASGSPAGAGAPPP